ncbi:type I-U CRISPR-associated protein Csx17 [Gemmata sp. JC717]|uniref:type I-G CRISPR-associated protein Cas8g1/Csx17 n=1 Tax=Gemmata algarum TaxID=2975278 RepID=UPI0021BA9686|nr:type I-U CRISPR-associated protein Csx17 [Gemmata algarum]MDY3556149.1 type I-U CRISPR-associated protein Csx17 [Gemmata algarum]
MNDPLSLDGCAPEPLMGYLKALGVLRLVSEQKDPDARGFWEDGVFKLTTALDRDGLVKFFRDEYKPTSLLAPWNGGSGFYVKLDLDGFLESGGKEVAFKDRDVVSAINAIESSDVERLIHCGNQIRETKNALGTLAERVDFVVALAEPLSQWPGATTKAAQKKVKDDATKILNTMMLFRSGEDTFSIGKAAKDEFVSDLRGKVLTDDGLFWLDAALAMRTGQKKNRTESPTLGSGGNIGNSDFSARFAQMLPKVMPVSNGKPLPVGSALWLDAALFGTPAPQLDKASVDQFDPGKAGGANGTQGMEADPTLNPWDYLLMMEGALALAGNTSRRLGAGRAAASFPFVVESSPAGHGSIGSDNTRGEAWLPLWTAPTLFGEVKLLLSEGRAEVGRVRAWSGLTFAQAVAGLGVDRGIGSFVRYEFQERLGQSYIATPVGRFDVPSTPVAGIELVRALNPLINSLQMVADEKAPARFATSLRRIESAVFDFCKYSRNKDDGKDRLAAILAALGSAERELAVGDTKPDKRRTRRPLAGLVAGWLTAANDGSTEFRLARSIAFLQSGTKDTGPARQYLEPVEYNAKFRSWAWGERGGHVVWGSGDLARNLGAVVVRRLMDAEKKGEPIPPFGSPFPAALSDISAFLYCETDDEKLEELLWGLSLVDRGAEWELPISGGPVAVPRAYALMKLTLLPGRLRWEPGLNGDTVLRLSRPSVDEAPSGIAVKPEPAIAAKLRAGDVQGACEVAARRLRASGFSLIGGFLADGAHRDIDWASGETSPERLLAALLLPIPDVAVNQLADLVLRRPSAETLV